jgi:hypothetical protein
MSNFMMDIETLGVKPGCQILTIAVARFDKNNIYERFYKRVVYPNQYPLTIDNSTLKWWQTQSQAVRDEAFNAQPREELKDILIELNRFLEKNTKSKIHMWSHGKEFDIPIIEYAYSLFNLPILWKFWDTRDTRTLYDFCKIDLKTINVPENFEAHNAMGDVLRQIIAVQKCYNLRTF